MDEKESAPAQQHRWLKPLVAAATASLLVGLVGYDPDIEPISEAEATIYTGPGGRCTGWTDGCVICVKRWGGDVSCSNIGLACQPGKLACTAQ